MMKTEFVNPFIAAAINVFRMMCGSDIKRGELSARRGIFTSQQCNIILGVTGQLEGQLIYGMSLTTAHKIIAQMLGTPVKTFDELAASAIAEIGNMISGAALTDLAASGFSCSLSPPSILRGSNVRVSTLDIPTLVIPLETDFGTLEINVSMQMKSK